ARRLVRLLRAHELLTAGEPEPVELVGHELRDEPRARVREVRVVLLAERVRRVHAGVEPEEGVAAALIAELAPEPAAEQGEVDERDALLAGEGAHALGVAAVRRDDVARAGAAALDGGRERGVRAARARAHGEAAQGRCVLRGY